MPWLCLTQNYLQTIPQPPPQPQPPYNDPFADSLFGGVAFRGWMGFGFRNSATLIIFPVEATLVKHDDLYIFQRFWLFWWKMCPPHHRATKISFGSPMLPCTLFFRFCEFLRGCGVFIIWLYKMQVKLMENNYSHHNVWLQTELSQNRPHNVYVDECCCSCVPVLLLVALLVFPHSMLWDMSKTAIMSHVALIEMAVIHLW